MTTTAINLDQLDGEGLEIRSGRYMIPEPPHAGQSGKGGKPKSWTRATTMAKTVEDTFALNQYHQRLVAKGIATRPDLHAQAAGLPLDQKKAFNELCDQARQAAGSDIKSGLGTGLHTFTENADLGIHQHIPEQWAADIAAYRKTMARAPVTVLPEYVECYAVTPCIGVAGKFDRLLQEDGHPYLTVADLKTGNIDLALGAICIQEAIYANATHLYDPATGLFTPMPLVDLKRAIVIHLPVGEARCELFEVNIEAGWELAVMCHEIRNYRTRKDLIQPLFNIGDWRVPDTEPKPIGEILPAAIAAIPDTPTAPKDPFAGLPDDHGRPQPDINKRRAWLQERIDTLMAIDGGTGELIAYWPDDMPTLKQSTAHSMGQLDAIDTALSAAEKTVRAPFAEPDPTNPRHIHVAADDPRVTDIAVRLAVLPRSLQDQVHEQAVRQHRIPRLSTGTATEAQLAIVLTALTEAEARWAVDEARITGLFDTCEAMGIPYPFLPFLRAARWTHLSEDYFKSTRYFNGEFPDLGAADIDPTIEARWLALLDAFDRGWLAINTDGDALLVDQQTAVIDAFGNRTNLLAAARKTAKEHGLDVPRDTPTVLGDPLLVALLFQSINESTNS